MARRECGILTARGRVRVAFERRGDRWRATWWWEGRRHRWSCRTGDLREAQTLAEPRVLAVCERQHHGRWTLATAVEDYLRSRWGETGPGSGDPARATWVEHRVRLRALAKNRPILDLRQTEARDVQGWLRGLVRERAGRFAPQTLRNDQRVWSRFCTWLRAEGIEWSYNPAQAGLLQLPPFARRVPRPPPDDTVRRLLGYVRDRDEVLYGFLVLVLCGARPCGAARVAWADLRAGHVVTVLEKRRPHVVTLSEWAWEELARLHGGTLPCADGTRVYPYAVTAAGHRLRLLVREAGLPRITLADLRRAVQARLDAAANAPMALRAAVMGHSETVADRHYRAVGAQDARALADEALDWK